MPKPCSPCIAEPRECRAASLPTLSYLHPASLFHLQALFLCCPHLSRSVTYRAAAILQNRIRNGCRRAGCGQIGRGTRVRADTAAAQPGLTGKTDGELCRHRGARHPSAHRPRGTGRGQDEPGGERGTDLTRDRETPREALLMSPGTAGPRVALQQSLCWAGLLSSHPAGTAGPEQSLLI